MDSNTGGLIATLREASKRLRSKNIKVHEDAHRGNWCWITIIKWRKRINVVYLSSKQRFQDYNYQYIIVIISMTYVANTIHNFKCITTGIAFGSTVLSLLRRQRFLKVELVKVNHTAAVTQSFWA